MIDGVLTTLWHKCVFAVLGLLTIVRFITEIDIRSTRTEGCECDVMGGRGR